MSHFIGRHDLMKMIFLVCIVSIFLASPAIATGKLGFLVELPGREEFVKWAGYGEEKLSTVVIDGKLLCRGAAAEETTSVRPYPVSGARVAVFCGASGKTKKSGAQGSTDSQGNFLIDLPSHLHAIPNLEKICHVKVVHLPKGSPCRRACTASHKPIQLTSIGEGIRTYSAHTINLMPHKHK